MSAPDPRTLPGAPPSEVEWEELLVRIEVAPRALRMVVEDVAGDPGARAPLRAAVEEERRLQEALEAMATGGASSGLPPGGDEDADPARLARHFASLRARTFALVQRRGLEVWTWRVAEGPLAGATAYQLLQAAAARDGRMLAALREGAP